MCLCLHTGHTSPKLTLRQNVSDEKAAKLVIKYGGYLFICTFELNLIATVSLFALSLHLRILFLRNSYITPNLVVPTISSIYRSYDVETKIKAAGPDK